MPVLDIRQPTIQITSLVGGLRGSQHSVEECCIGLILEVVTPQVCGLRHLPVSECNRMSIMWLWGS